jgi:UPF0755 protein
MAAIVEAHGFGSAAAFVDAAKDVSLIRAVDPAATDLEGYLFPETYSLSRHTDASTIVRLMVGRFLHVWGPDLRAAAEARGLSVRQAVTLASIVEKETARSDERPLIAAVYTTRLRIGMPLQCDPTVIYALQEAGQYKGTLSGADLHFQSPYNTYAHPGLPPGPIGNPGEASLRAALQPAQTDYLYFVANTQGGHFFAATLSEHNRNVTKYRRLLAGLPADPPALPPDPPAAHNQTARPQRKHAATPKKSQVKQKPRAKQQKVAAQ